MFPRLRISHFHEFVNICQKEITMLYSKKTTEVIIMDGIDFLIIAGLLSLDIVLHVWGLIRLDQIRDDVKEVLRWM